MKNKFFHKPSLMVFIVTCLFGLLFIGCNNKKSNSGDTANDDTETSASAVASADGTTRNFNDALSSTEESTSRNNLASAPTMDLSVVPNDAILVAHLNLKNIWNKGDFNNIRDVSFVKLLLQELKNEDLQLSDFVNTLLDDPNSCGLGLKGDIFFFTSDLENEYGFRIGLGVNNAQRFKDFLKDLGEKADIDIDFEAENGFNSALIENGLACCWNNQKAYFFPVRSWSDRGPKREMSIYANQLMALDEKESLAQNYNLKRFLLGNQDLGCYLDYAAVNNDIKREFGRDEREIYESLIQPYKNAAICYTLNFETGSVKLQGAVVGAEGKNEFFSGDFNKSLVNYLPQQALAAATLSFNLNNFINLMEKMGRSADLNEKAYNDYSVKNILKSFSGNIAVSLSDLTIETQKHSYYDYYYDREQTYETTNTIPVFTVAAELKNNRVLKNIFDDMKEQGDLTASDNGYEINLGDMNISLKISDDVFMISNDGSAAAAFSRGGSSMGIERVAAKAKRGNYAYWNMNLADYSPSVRKALGLDASVLRMIEDYFKDAEVVYDKDGQTLDVVLNIKNNDRNSLKYTIDYIDNNLVTIFNLFQ